MGNLPGTLTLIDGGIRADTRQALHNIVAVLQGRGLGLENQLRCTVMLSDIGEWAEFNAVYAEFFSNVPMPARSVFGCNWLALGARVEIECTAARRGRRSGACPGEQNLIRYEAQLKWPCRWLLRWGG